MKTPIKVPFWPSFFGMIALVVLIHFTVKWTGIEDSWRIGAIVIVLIVWVLLLGWSFLVADGDKSNGIYPRK